MSTGHAPWAPFCQVALRSFVGGVVGQAFEVGLW